MKLAQVQLSEFDSSVIHLFHFNLDHNIVRSFSCSTPPLSELGGFRVRIWHLQRLGKGVHYVKRCPHTDIPASVYVCVLTEPWWRIWACTWTILVSPPPNLHILWRSAVKQWLKALISSSSHMFPPTLTPRPPSPLHLLHRGLIISLPPPPVIQDHQTVNNVLNVRFPHLGY